MSAGARNKLSGILKPQRHALVVIAGARTRYVLTLSLSLYNPLCERGELDYIYTAKERLCAAGGFHALSLFTL